MPHRVETRMIRPKTVRSAFRERLIGVFAARRLIAERIIRVMEPVEVVGERINRLGMRGFWRWAADQPLWDALGGRLGVDQPLPSSRFTPKTAVRASEVGGS